MNDEDRDRDYAAKAAATKALVPTAADKATASALVLAHANLDLAATISLWNQIAEDNRGFQSLLAVAELLITATGMRENPAVRSNLQAEIYRLSLEANDAEAGEEGDE